MAAILINKENTSFKDAQHYQSDQLKKIRSQLNDTLFQLKKIQEDNASQKALMVIQFSKDKKKADQTIKELKSKIVHENQYWTQKVDSLRAEFKALAQKSKQEFNEKTQQAQFLLKRQISNNFEETIHKLENKILFQDQKYTQKIQSQIKTYNQKIIILQNNLLKKQAEIEIYAVKKVQQKSRQYQKLIESFKKINSQQQSTIKMYKIEVKSLKQELKFKQTKYQEEIFRLTNQNFDLKQKNEHFYKLAQQLKQKCDTVQIRKSNEVQRAKQQFQNALQQKQNFMNKKIKQIESQWKQDCEKLEDNIKKILSATFQKQRLLDQKTKTILDSYERRLSKEEDIKKIEHLQMKLIKKQMDLQKQRQQVKTYKMQIENLEQFYGKLFESQSYKNQRLSSFKSRKIKVPPVNRSKNNTREIIEQSF